MCLESPELLLGCLARGNNTHQGLQFRVCSCPCSQHLNHRIWAGLRWLALLSLGRLLSSLGRRRIALIRATTLLGGRVAACIPRATGRSGRVLRRSLLIGWGGIRSVLLEVIRVAIVNHRSLRGCVLECRWRTGIFDNVNHGIEEMGTDGDIARPNFCHSVLRWVVLLDLFALRLLRLCVVSHKDAIT